MFKLRIFCKAIDAKNGEQTVVAETKTRLITDDSVLVHYFNKAFFELIKKYDENNISGQISFSDNQKYKIKSYFLPNSALDETMTHLSDAMFGKEKFCQCDIDMKIIFYFLVENKDKCDFIRFDIYPTKIEEQALLKDEKIIF